jgi:hypothetical protein
MQKLFKKIFTLIGITFGAFTVFVILYFTIAYMCAGITINKAAKPINEVPIYIMTNGVHTDIVVPVRTDQIDWNKEVKYTYTDLKDRATRSLHSDGGIKDFICKRLNGLTSSFQLLLMPYPAWVLLPCILHFTRSYLKMKIAGKLILVKTNMGT